MIITPITTEAQDTTLANNSQTVDGLLKTLIEYKLNWLKDQGYTYNNCSLTVEPSSGAVTLTTGQENYLLQDMADIEVWVQNFIDTTCRRLDDGKELII